MILLLLACATPPEPPPVHEAPLAEADPVEITEEAPPEIEPPPPAPPEDPYAGQRSAPPEGFVDLTARIPSIHIDVAYHRSDNFTGAPLPGYGVPGAWMLEEAGEALARVQDALAPEGLGLLVYDAYRPLRGTLGMVAWAQRTDQVHLLDNGYIARRSGHNHGHTIDLTLAKLGSGEALDMGTPWDTLTKASHTRNATGQALENRLKLKDAMEAQGFKNYSKEWWHFSMKLEGTRGRDVPYACFEAPEGAWEAPEGWEQPGYEMPQSWSPRACGAPGG
ncbi:MAG: hypothetical protein H6741_28250 [Alphaproteobacteria bacterium]|nr:hypothetical protein [Alphaproteobacteria bacterium]MCB9796608.1 hypothetical protein [Alphaproteobacteria bacterium]